MLYSIMQNIQIIFYKAIRSGKAGEVQSFYRSNSDTNTSTPTFLNFSSHKICSKSIATAVAITYKTKSVHN